MEEGYTTERLIVAIARRDNDAFKRLYDAAAPQLFAITLRLCRDRRLAEEALQDTFTAVWRHAASFDARRRVSGMTWLSAIARNRASGALRRAAHPGAAGTGTYQKDKLRLPDLDAARQDYAELDKLMRCVDALDKLQQRALLLSYYEGCSGEELSRRLDAPAGKIRAGLRSAFAGLRRCLEAGR